KLFLFFSFSAFSQTTWTVPGTYSTIAAAVTAINSGGVPAGGLTINVSAGHTETSVNISLNTTTSSAVNPILIQKSGGGANPLIQSSSAGSGSSISNDCFFKIFKTDYVTIDGIDLLENYTGTTTTPAIEFGYFITKQNNDACNYITIRNCNISLSLNASNTIGIYQSCIHGTTGAAVSVNNVGGQCNYNSYYANTIENAYYGISLNGFNATTYPDLNCSIGVGGGNTVTDFGISSFTTPIRAYWQRHITIANNTVSGGLGSSSTIYGISITGANNSNADVYNNTVTLLNSGYTKGIYLTSGSLTGGATNTINIYNNTITGCVNGALSAEFGGIIHETTATTANIYGNTISNNASGQLLYCISSAASSNNLNIYNNVVSDCTATDNFFGVSRAYYTSLAFDGNMNFYNNETYNITSYNSTFELCLFTGSFGTTGVQNFYNNRFYNITQNSSYGSGVYFIGMTLPYGEDVYCYNNMISGFTIGAGSTCESVYGIRSFNNYSLGNNYIAYNTVALNVTGNSPNFTSSALYINSTNTRVINNIFSNKSNHLGTGKTCAIEKSSSMTLSEYESINNNNCLYAGTGSANYLFFDGTTGYSTLAAFQSLVSPADANSISIDPSAYFTSTNDVHISLCSGCPLENAGTVYAAVSTDYDYEARSASAPEIGADEIVLILPVVLSNFAASSLQTFVQLSWETQSEINNDHFVIERSSDAKTFTEIGSVLGAGNTSSATIYTFTDENPEAGMNFYRLRQVDANGQYTFSKIENAYIQPTSLCMLLENPVLEHIQIRIFSHENTPVQILLTDLNGKIYISEIAGKSGFSEVLSFPAQHLPNGVYILQCIIGEQHTTFKVVKQ
ncbi:MAG: T9SS type A sorting domain-containing protein, partial [Chitinophagales bacterium]